MQRQFLHILFIPYVAYLLIILVIILSLLRLLLLFSIYLLSNYCLITIIFSILLYNLKLINNIFIFINNKTKRTIANISCLFIIIQSNYAVIYDCDELEAGRLVLGDELVEAAAFRSAAMDAFTSRCNAPKS